MSVPHCSQPPPCLVLCSVVVLMLSPSCLRALLSVEVEMERARVKKPRITIERRIVNKHTEIFRKSVGIEGATRTRGRLQGAYSLRWACLLCCARAQ